MGFRMSGSGTKVLSIQYDNPILADDVTYGVLTASDLPSMLNKAYIYSRKWNVQFAADKSGVFLYDDKQNPSKIKFVSGDHFIKETNCNTHLGILQDTRLTHVVITKAACSKGRKPFFPLHTYGAQILGINPLTSKSLYKNVGIPTTLYDFELSQMSITALSKLQNFLTKKLQGFSLRTRSIMCESMIGLLSLLTEIERRKLIIYIRYHQYQIISLPNNFSTDVYFSAIKI